MPLAALAIEFFLKNPDLAAKTLSDATRPGSVNIQEMKASFADLTKGILECYHRTARYRSADVVQVPWMRQDDYGAERSFLVRINYSGVSGAKYEMLVGVLGKDGKVRTSVQADNASIPYSSKCALDGKWVSAESKASPAKVR